MTARQKKLEKFSTNKSIEILGSALVQDPRVNLVAMR
jgi:hypothetical protein